MLRLTPRINSLDYKSKENIPQGKNSSLVVYDKKNYGHS